MTIDEIRRAKELLEIEIRDFLAPRFDHFAKQTGCAIEGLSTIMITFQTLDSRIPSSHVSRVSLSINTGL